METPLIIQPNRQIGGLLKYRVVADFLLTTPADHLEEYYEPGKELAVASSPEELVDQCRYYLNHEYERKAIAQRGYERTIAEHTWSHRLRDIFMHIGFRAVPNQLPINNKSTAFVKSSMACIPKSEEGSTLDCAHEKLLDNDQDKIDTSIIVLGIQQIGVHKKMRREHSTLHCEPLRTAAG